MNLPDMASLRVGLSSRNAPTLNDRVIVSPVVGATITAGEAVEGAQPVTVQLTDCFGLPVGGHRLVWLVCMDGAGTLTGSVLNVAPGLWLGQADDDGVLSLSWAAGTPRTLGVWLPNGECVTAALG